MSMEDVARSVSQIGHIACVLKTTKELMLPNYKTIDSLLCAAYSVSAQPSFQNLHGFHQNQLTSSAGGHSFLLQLVFTALGQG